MYFCIAVGITHHKGSKKKEITNSKIEPIVKQYKAEYAGGAAETFEAKNDAEAIRRASEIGFENNHPQFYAVFLLDDDGNEIKRL